MSTNSQISNTSLNRLNRILMSVLTATGLVAVGVYSIESAQSQTPQKPTPRAQTGGAGAETQLSPYAQAVGLYNTRKFAEALVILETGKIDPAQAANASYYRALCYHQQGNMKQAAAAYRFVVSKYPQSVAARNSLKTLMKLDPTVAQQVTKVLDEYQPGKIDWTGLPDQVSVPFRKARNGGIMVTAELNGVPITMAFDTGASSTTCTDTFLTNSKITVKKTNYHGRSLGVGGEIPTSLAMVDLKLGDLKRKLPLMVQDDRGLQNTTDHLPLLGQTFFGDMPYMVDDAREMIVFTKPAEDPGFKIAGGKSLPGKAAPKPRLAANEVPFRRSGGNIVITVQVNGRECEMYFDTGADTVAFADRHLASCGLNRPVDAYAGQSGGVGGKREAFGFLIDSMKIANVERRSVKACVLINANFDRPLLGQTFLSGLKYTIDPVKNCIRFD
jgi:clan AA aspartic protease (TIGR02281 family)